MLDFLAIGPWTEAQLEARWTESSHRPAPEVERLIDAAWADAKARLGDRLFDGPLCRLEGWQARPDHLDLQFSPTRYRPFLGTNVMHPELAGRYGPDVLANPVGLSPALLTADGLLVMGRRNGSVAYYPWHVHPFAGALEPPDVPQVFNGVRRELSEELALSAADVHSLQMLGIVRDRKLLQPEFIFAAQTRATLPELERRMDLAEHHDIWWGVATAEGLERIVASVGTPGGERLTPVGVATLLLFGRLRFGDDWFHRHRARLAP